MCRISALLFVALLAGCEAWSFSFSWTSISQGADGQAVQETHGLVSDGQEVQEIRSVFTQDAGGIHGTTEEVRCVGGHCAERLTVVGPAARVAPAAVALRGAAPPCHRSHAQGAPAMQALPAMQAVEPVDAPSAPAVFPKELSDDVSGFWHGLPQGQFVAFAAAGFIATAALAVVLIAFYGRTLKTGARETQMQTLQQFLLPDRAQSAASLPRQRPPTAQEDLRASLRDVEKAAFESYTFSLYARCCCAPASSLITSDSEARPYMLRVYERACSA